MIRSFLSAFMALILVLLPWPPVASAALGSFFAPIQQSEKSLPLADAASGASEAGTEAGSETAPEKSSGLNTANFVEEIEGHDHNDVLPMIAVVSVWIPLETGTLFPVTSAPAHRPPIAS